MREPECIELKRKGSRYVESLVSGLTLQQQLEFWQKRTESMRNRQRTARKTQALQEV